MGRLKKLRKVGYVPQNKCFMPTDIVGRVVEEVNIGIDEMETLRLSNLEGLEQDVAAEKMEVSRSTFQRMLDSARYKITDALVNGKVVKIQGGNFEQNICCIKCEYYKDKKCCKGYKEKDYCPKHKSGNTVCVSSEEFCRKNCARYENDE